MRRSNAWSIAFAGVLVACGTARSEDPEPSAVEVRTVTLTLWRFWDVSEDENGFLAPAPLDGVNVCVKKARPVGGSWDQFRDVTDRCTDTVTRTKDDKDVVVLRDVPANSELIVTAEKDGYRSAALSVTTGFADMDATSPDPAAVDPQWMRLQRIDGAHRGLGVSLRPALGSLSFDVVSCVFPDFATRGCPYMGGVTVTLLDENSGAVPGASGPFYWSAGKVEPGATTTLPGGPPPERGTSFVNVEREGDYVIHLARPGGDARCRTFGAYFGIWLNGYASANLDEVRAPVLASHTTINLLATCHCNTELASPGSADPQTCSARAPDAGAL